MGLESYNFRAKKSTTKKNIIGKFLESEYELSGADTLEKESKSGFVEIEISDFIWIRTAKLNHPDIIKEIYSDLMKVVNDNGEIYDLQLKKYFKFSSYEESLHNFEREKKEFSNHFKVGKYPIRCEDVWKEYK